MSATAETATDITEAEGLHVIMISQLQAVAEVIKAAAAAVDRPATAVAP